MTKNPQPENQDNQNPKQLYRVQLLRTDVERLDDMKWELRTSRRKLLDRIMRLSFWLIDQDKFYQLEQQMETVPEEQATL